ncbi:MAG: ureidoglycolate lyase [Cyanobacteria bacterium J06635_15]
MAPTSTQKQLLAQPISTDNFAPFGQVIFPNSDGKAFDTNDAQLDLSQGTPRFYIMQLQRMGRSFHKITRHQRCTQCLGAMAGQSWLMAVAPPGADPCPQVDAIQAFTIPGNCFIKLAVGTWHAGPLFEQDQIDFFNLELSDTNITDHDTCNLRQTYGLDYEIIIS